MTIKHINRKGQTYYLHQGTTKSGKPNYFFALRDQGKLVETVPQGYEVYENPNGQVFLRKIRPQIITQEEIAEVEAGMKYYCRLERFIVDVKKDAIIMYTPDQGDDFFSDMYEFLPSARKTEAKKQQEKYLTYSPMLRFVLTNKEKRLFQPWRYCFLGSIDDWITIGGIDTLTRLVQAYVRHLGEESFYDLY